MDESEIQCCGRWLLGLCFLSGEDVALAVALVSVFKEAPWAWTLSAIRYSHAAQGSGDSRDLVGFHGRRN